VPHELLVNILTEVYIDPQIDNHLLADSPDVIESLWKSIESNHGLRHRLVIFPRQKGRMAQHQFKYELGDGYRRCAALQILAERDGERKWVETVPATIRTGARAVTYQVAKNLIDADCKWLVYGGDDGSVLVYKPQPTKYGLPVWEKLRQCRSKDPGYWRVSLAGDHYDAQAIVLWAFVGCAPNGAYVAMHGDDDRDNNRPDNLSWGTKRENLEMRMEHSKANELRRSLDVGATISMNCSDVGPDTKTKRRYIWHGKFVSADGLILQATSQLPSHVVSELMYRARKKREGVAVLPGQQIENSGMPEKDKELFAVQSEWVCGHTICKPEEFLIGANGKPFLWCGQFYPGIMRRCLPRFRSWPGTAACSTTYAR